MREKDEAQLRLLREVVEKRDVASLKMVDVIGQRLLTSQEREDLRHLVADELIDTGLEPNDEHNERGRRLEDLIDWLRHVSEWE